MEEKLSVMLSEEEVDKRIREIAEQINKDYEGKEIHLIGILRGASFFMCELGKRITVPVTVDFMSVSSYGNGTISSGTIKIKKDLDDSIEGKHVILVEDIIDSGRTLSCLGPMLKERGAASVKLCTLLDKPDRREVLHEILVHIGIGIGGTIRSDQQFRAIVERSLCRKELDLAWPLVQS